MTRLVLVTLLALAPTAQARDALDLVDAVPVMPGRVMPHVELVTGQCHAEVRAVMVPPDRVSALLRAEIDADECAELRKLEQENASLTIEALRESHRQDLRATRRQRNGERVASGGAIIGLIVLLALL